MFALEGRGDPTPSRWAWRMQRLMLTPVFRQVLRFGIPLAAVGACALAVWASPVARQSVTDQLSQLRAGVEERPEFSVTLMAVDGADQSLTDLVRRTVPIDFPVSSFDLDLETLRSQIIDIPAIKDARVMLRAGGVLHVDITPRVPVALWRREEGLYLVDVEGIEIGLQGVRAGRADLPVIVGTGADAAADEIPDLMAHMGPLKPRLRGFVRQGERRWDVVLDRGQRILLPEDDAILALEYVVALDAVEQVFARDVSQLDMRILTRPTLRQNTSDL